MAAEHTTEIMRQLQRQVQAGDAAALGQLQVYCTRAGHELVNEFTADGRNQEVRYYHYDTMEFVTVRMKVLRCERCKLLWSTVDCTQPEPIREEKTTGASTAFSGYSWVAHAPNWTTSD